MNLALRVILLRLVVLIFLPHHLFSQIREAKPFSEKKNLLRSFLFSFGEKKPETPQNLFSQYEIKSKKALFLFSITRERKNFFFLKIFVSLLLPRHDRTPDKTRRRQDKNNNDNNNDNNNNIVTM